MLLIPNLFLFLNSNILTALAVGIEIGVAPIVGILGGITITVPTMLFWYVPTGLAEALFRFH